MTPTIPPRCCFMLWKHLFWNSGIYIEMSILFSCAIKAARRSCVTNWSVHLSGSTHKEPVVWIHLSFSLNTADRCLKYALQERLTTQPLFYHHCSTISIPISLIFSPHVEFKSSYDAVKLICPIMRWSQEAIGYSLRKSSPINPFCASGGSQWNHTEDCK